MAEASTDKFSAGEQGLGYIYQARLALLQLLQLSEDTAIFLEKDDDLDFMDGDGGKSLASLKHKAIGDRLALLDVIRMHPDEACACLRGSGHLI